MSEFDVIDRYDMQTQRDVAEDIAALKHASDIGASHIKAAMIGLRRWTKEAAETYAARTGEATGGQR